MRVLACATETNRGVERLLGSAARHGVEVDLVAAGERWSSNAAKLRSLAGPLGRLREKNELVLIVDAYDVLFFAGTDEIERRYGESDVEQPLFNGEQGFYCPAPWADEARAAFAAGVGKVPYPFLNSGVLLGRAAALHDLLADAAEVAERHRLTSDQAAFYKLAIQAPDRVAVDHFGRLFCCTGAMPFRGLWNRRPRAVRLDGETLVDLATGTRPCLLHSPGRKDRYQERVYRRSMPAR